MAESAEGDVRYLLSDGLGSVRQAMDDASRGTLVAYHEFDPYGNPIDSLRTTHYGFTGEWWERYWPQRGRFALLLHHHLKPRNILSTG
jgi:hypothetical protein